MSSFFTLPASERKRKRADKSSAGTSKKQRGSAVSAFAPAPRGRVRPNRDESISGSDSEIDNDAGDAAIGSGQDASDSYDASETGAERRLRLAEQYLDNLKQEFDETGYDAADLDRDLIAERLKEDVSESKGKLYRYIATDFDYPAAAAVSFRTSADTTTAIGVHAPYIYTATKDAVLTKWELPPQNAHGSTEPALAASRSKAVRPPRCRPRKVKSTRGKRRSSSDTLHRHHSGPILCLAVSSDGRFLATGGADKRLIVWSTDDMEALRVFSQHRDAVLGLAFRHGTNQLYSGSADRTIKTWSLNELAYVETLFGHQDAVLDVAALAQERCLSAGARDRTVRLWKVVEETQLVFRGGGGIGKGAKNSEHPQSEVSNSQNVGAEGSIERVAFIDDETFVSGSDNGVLSLWSVNRKKPVFSLNAAHGFDPAPSPEEYFAEVNLEGRKMASSPQARWITALKALPYSDLFVSGSWDGHIRIWKVSADKKKIVFLATLGSKQHPAEERNRTDGSSDGSTIKGQGFVNDLHIFQDGPRGNECLYIVAALGREHRLGRWKKVRGQKGAVLFKVPKTGER